MMNRSFLFLLLALIIYCTSIAQNKFVSGFNLNFRSSPAIEKGNIIGTIDHGEAVIELQVVDSVWSKITYKDKTGYVASRYLSDHEPATLNQPVTNQPKQKLTVLICESSGAYAYHSYKCRGLSRCTHNISRVSTSVAKQRGYRACKICY